MQKTRESNYDLLRIISAFAIIVLHVSGTFMESPTGVNGETATLTCYINALTRFAVPCFLLLSGAFLLSNDKNADYNYFYKKAFKTIGIPVLIFTGIYIIPELLAALLIAVVDKSYQRLIDAVTMLITGEPAYHMWYVYMLIGVYLLIPIVIKVRKEMSPKTFETISYIFFVLACISLWFSERQIKWDIGSSFCYLSFLCVGYNIRAKTISNKNSLKGVLFILLGMIPLLIMGFIFDFYPAKALENIPLGNSYSILSASSGVLMFYGFSNLTIKANVSKLASLTFTIYLVHVFVLTQLMKILVQIPGAHNDLLIPVYSIIVFIISAIIAILYNKAQDVIENKIKFKKIQKSA